MPSAYIDPGTGFTLFSSGAWLIAILLASLGVVLIFFKKILNFMRRRWQAFAIALLALAVLSSIIVGIMTMGTRKSKFDKKIIILGFDGLSPEIIEPMMDAGALPNFSLLREKGSYSHLSTTNPAQSPVAWAGFSTGQNGGKNGVFDFIVRDPKTYELTLSLSNIRKGRPRRVLKSKAFWQYASDKGVEAVIIAAPLTFPPDKIHGRMLSGMGVPDILGTEGTFTFYSSEPSDQSDDVGGKTFHVRKSPMMILNLIGPKVVSSGGNARNVDVPFKVSLLEDRGAAIIEYQGNKFEIVVGRWSGWKEVNFDVGFLRKARGILKFYLAEASPDFKLYISPINFDPRRPFYPISHPKGYSRELAEDIGLYYTQGMPMDTWAVNRGRLNENTFLEQVTEVLREKRAMLEVELNRLERGILFCYFESPDIIQHMFWRYIDPKHPLYDANAPQRYKEIIRTWYRYMDDILGVVAKKIGEEDTLIALSDHGFNTFRRAAHVNGWLRANGYLELDDPKAKSSPGLLKGIDWSKTKAYAIGFGAVYINQRGREGEGIVSPGAETEMLREELSKKLKAWFDEKYGQPVVKDVYPREEIFWGEHADLTPDLYIGFNIGSRASWQTALGGVSEAVIEDNLKSWSGSHLFDPKLIPGVIFSSRKIEKENPSIYDISPTILKIIGCDDAQLKEGSLDGEPLFH